MKDFSSALNAKLALEGKDKSVKERGEIPNHKKPKKEKPLKKSKVVQMGNPSLIEFE